VITGKTRLLFLAIGLAMVAPAAQASDEAIIITRSDVLQYESINPSAYLKHVKISSPTLPRNPASLAPNPVWPSDIIIEEGRISNGYFPTLAFPHAPNDAEDIEPMVLLDGSDHFTPLETPYKFRKTDTN
jgi:hypothetical protein